MIEKETYRVEIYAYIEIDANSTSDAIEKVREQFDTEQLTYMDLSFEAEKLLP